MNNQFIEKILKFYADPANYIFNLDIEASTIDNIYKNPKVLQDAGKKARKLLKILENVKKENFW